jgi:hypothetical protein
MAPMLLARSSTRCMMIVMARPFTWLLPVGAPHGPLPVDGS